MEKISSLSNIQVYEDAEASPTMTDTSFVLFFLAADTGQNLGRIGLETVVMTIVLMAVAVFPYFMLDENVSLGKWLAGRSVIAGFAVLLGVLFNQGVGTVFPEAFSFLPFTLLILTAMLSCYIQFYNFFRFRLSN